MHVVPSLSQFLFLPFSFFLLGKLSIIFHKCADLFETTPTTKNDKKNETMTDNIIIIIVRRKKVTCSIIFFTPVLILFYINKAIFNNY